MTEFTYTVDSDSLRPAMAHHDDAGWDLCAKNSLSLWPGERRLVATGVSVAIPAGHAGLICPRSGLALKYGITVLNAPGIIDAGYRGEIGVILINHSKIMFSIKRGDRIAQLVVIPLSGLIALQVDELDNTARSSSGFGSSGTGKLLH